MLNQQLINPRSILVAGGSNNLEKPGGNVLHNIIKNGYQGELCVLNPHQAVVQGLQACQTADGLPQVIDLAVIAIAAADCPSLIAQLANQHHTKAFIVVSAGFSELNEHGAQLEQEMKAIVDSVDGCLIGPNCIGVITPCHSSVFTTPTPKPMPGGVDMITASGAMAVFTMEAGLEKGVRFNHIFSVGNGIQTSVEDVLAYMDENFSAQSSRIITLYFESIRHPQLLLKHALSLHQKGCTIAAIKAGTSTDGSRAAASHTGALAVNDEFIDALFRKAGIIRCYSREQLINVAAILTHKQIKGQQVAIITHAGGPAVLLTDTLSKAGIKVPPMPSDVAADLLPQLNAGSSAGNPIDLLATGTAAQLALAIDCCENRFDAIGAIVVIFGSAGLFNVAEVYDTLARKQKSCTKPIFAVLPSVMNAKTEMETFINQGNICFTDEVIFGEALSAVINQPIACQTSTTHAISTNYITSQQAEFLTPDNVNELLDQYKISRAKEFCINTIYELEHIAGCLTFPVVAKASGLIHKTESGGVITHINSFGQLTSAFNQLMAIDGCTAIIIQPQISGFELYIGAKREPGYPPLMVFGAGGIHLEMFKDVVSVLTPVSTPEVLDHLKKLKCFTVFKGFRGMAPVNANQFADIIVSVAEMMLHESSIIEMDLNPLIASDKTIISVDARIKRI